MEVQQLVENGIAALRAGDSTEARRLLADAIVQDPRNEKAWLYLSALLPRQQAIAALERVITLNPNNSQAQRGLDSFKATPQSGRPAASFTTTPVRVARPSQNTKNSGIEELPMTGNEPPSRFTPPGGLHDSLRHNRLSEQSVFERGYYPLEVSQEQPVNLDEVAEAQALLQKANEQPVALSTELRDLLLAPYEQQKRRRFNWFWLLLPVLLLVAGGLTAYFLLFAPVASVVEPTPVAVQLPTATATPEAVISNLNQPTATPEPTIELPTATPAPTVTPTLRLNVAQEERAVLRGVALTFSQYENRSNNFSFGGAGVPKSNYHFEGLLVRLENTAGQILPVRLDNFQGVDGRSASLKPIGGGRVPALDVLRLQPGEARVGWLTFEVEDGTTLRRVLFNPTNQLDLNNSVAINLTLPAVTPTPTNAPTAKPSATPKPTNTPKPTSTATPIPPTNTVAPTTTPIPTATPIVAEASPGVYVPPVEVPATAIVPTSTPVATSTPVPTSTPVATTTPVPTNTPAPTAGPSPTPEPVRVTPGPQGQLGKRLVIDNSFALSVTNYVLSPTIKPPPLVLPPGYHYETLKVTLEVLTGRDVADYLSSFPFYLRDEDGQIYSVGPLTLEAKDVFDPRVFAPTATAPGKTKATGTLYFLVRDAARKQNRTLIFYASPDPASSRIEVPLSNP